MSEQISEEHDKVNQYLNVIKTRIMEPIRESDISRYCTATLLLLFAGIDGLGKLIHNNDKAGSNERIRVFLDLMGENYGKCKEELLDLRNSLVHNAINIASFMSSLSESEMGSEQHLSQIGSVDFIYINTTAMFNDFVRAFERLSEEIKKDEEKMKRAAARLEWRKYDYQDQYPGPQPTPPPAVYFIWAR
jgi:hypothetical protein